MCGKTMGPTNENSTGSPMNGIYATNLILTIKPMVIVLTNIAKRPPPWALYGFQLKCLPICFTVYPHEAPMPGHSPLPRRHHLHFLRPRYPLQITWLLLSPVFHEPPPISTI